MTVSRVSLGGCGVLAARVNLSEEPVGSPREQGRLRYVSSCSPIRGRVRLTSSLPRPAQAVQLWLGSSELSSLACGKGAQGDVQSPHLSCHLHILGS